MKRQLRTLFRDSKAIKTIRLFSRVDMEYWRDNPERVEQEIKRIFARKYRLL